ncbi:MAG: DUF6644 family protein [Gammaproteobacteria bacterium]
MSLIAFAEALTHTAPGAALRNASPSTVLGIQLGHVLGLILLLTSLLIVNLRLLGLGLRQQSLAQVTGSTRWALWTGAVLAIGSGSLLFLSAPVHYAGNAAFVPKMCLLAGALFVQATLYRAVTHSDRPSPLLARTTAVLSLTLWFSVGLFGRAIGFV